MHTSKRRNVLIFGGAGFVGSNLAHWFLAQTGARVHVFDNLSRQGSHHNVEWLKDIAGNGGQLELTIGDIRNRRLVEKAVSSADEIYHFAAQVAVTTSLLDPRLDFEVNVGGTFNILDAARQSRKKPFLLYTSTNKVYGDLGLGKPTRLDTRYSHPDHVGISESQPLDFHSPYGCSKGAADQYVRDFGRIYHFPVVVFRMSCIAGPRQFGTEDQGWVAHFLYSALQRKPVTIYGDGRQVRDVLCVHDLVRAMQAVRQHLGETAGQIYNIGGGPANTTSLLELMESIRKLTGIRLNYQLDETRPGDQQVYITDHTKLTNHTGWKPQIGIEQTLKLLQNFWRENQRAAMPSMEYTGPSWNGVQALERAS
ncbi:MAG TPA: GDP-mannose 4,6-dehydratase [Candidatus Angelobacter sp.]|nr:GDP-mannose 4,6-dehydratase [Candidatus Angelobacter sp.]